MFGCVIAQICIVCAWPRAASLCRQTKACIACTVHSLLTQHVLLWRACLHVFEFDLWYVSGTLVSVLRLAYRLCLACLVCVCLPRIQCMQ
jgi:hypothetical protein